MFAPFSQCFSVCASHLSGHILFAPQDARNSFLNNDLLCNDTFCVTGCTRGKDAEIRPFEQDNQKRTARVTSGAHIWARNLVLFEGVNLFRLPRPPVFFRVCFPNSGHIIFPPPHALDKSLHNDLLSKDTCSEIWGTNDNYAELGPCEQYNKQRTAYATSRAHTWARNLVLSCRRGAILFAPLSQCFSVCTSLLSGHILTAPQDARNTVFPLRFTL